VSNRRTPQPTDRIIRALRLDTPVSLGGRAVADSALSRTRANARAKQGFGTVSPVRGRRHWRDVLKAVGVAPVTTYTLTHFPVDADYWPSLFVSGVEQPPSTGWSTVGNLLTLAGGYGLLTGHDLIAEYDYNEDNPVPPPPPLTPFIAAATATNVAVTTVTVSIPSSRISGDVLIATVARGTAFTTPAGWTALDNQAVTDNSVFMFWKVSNGTETTVDLTVTTYVGNLELMAVVVVLRGINNSTPRASTVKATLSGATVTASQVTVTATSDYVLYVVHRDTIAGIGDFITAPVGVNVRGYVFGTGRFALMLADEISPVGTSPARQFQDPGASVGWASITQAMADV